MKSLLTKSSLPSTVHEAPALAFNTPNSNQQSCGGSVLESHTCHSMRVRRAPLLMALAAVFSLAAALPAQAEVWYFYPTVGEENWYEQQSWTNCPSGFCAGVPTNSDDIYFYGGVGSVNQFAASFPTDPTTFTYGTMRIGEMRVDLRLSGTEMNVDVLEVGRSSPYATNARDSELFLIGGTFNVAGFTAIGSTSTGKISMRSGTVFTAGHLALGNLGYIGQTTIGLFDVLDGSQASADELSIGFNDQGSGTVNVSGAGSTFTLNGNGNGNGNGGVGGSAGSNSGAGLLKVESGGEFSATGELEVWGSGTVSVTDATLSAADINVHSGGTVNLAGGSVSAASLNNEGTVAVTTDSALASTISNTNTGRVEVSNNATLTLAGDVTHNGEAIDIAAGSTVIFEGAVDGASDYTGTGTHIFEGSFGPGNSPGLVNIAGDVTYGAGHTLTMELAGVTPGSEYDVVAIAGTATLGGLLDVDLLSGFLPTLGDSFDLLMAATLVGTFRFDATLGDGLVWDLQYLRNDPSRQDVVRLSAVSAVPVPAAVWLFGSAILGLVAIGHRRRSVA